MSGLYGNSDYSSGKSVDPSLGFENSRENRYPNQFFDLGQQYMPPTIKELFKWCTFYYYNSPLIGAALKKVSRYPITDILVEDKSSNVKKMWDKILTKKLKLKVRLMEVNLDRNVYGNAFVSIHLPFTRMLICSSCKKSAPINQWNWKFNLSNAALFSGHCGDCKGTRNLDVKDVPYKSIDEVRIVRWSPENMHIKHNDYTGRYTYMYSAPAKLKRAVRNGDKDIVEDIPLIVIKAIKDNKLIRMDSRSIFHLKNPTLAEQDQGWGKPTIIHVLKDMFYLYTLRRAQEAVALEHIVPFDLIYPMPNSQMDPYIHTDLGDWKTKIEEIITAHRKDPNFKAILPVPVGFGRLGGDGKALLLSPEIDYVTKTVVGGMGIPLEFLFGGLNFTGSSISLRTLENDFIQNRSEMLDLVEWIKDKVRIWFSYPDVGNLRFADFRMADDIQRNQQLIGLNAQRKISDQTMLTELGYNYEEENSKLLMEAYYQNEIMDLQTKGSARSQGEAQVIQFGYQQRMQELAEKAQIEARKRVEELKDKQHLASNTGELQPDGNMQGIEPSGGIDVAGGEFQQPALPPAAQPGESPAQQKEQTDPNAPFEGDIEGQIEGWAKQLIQMDPDQAKRSLLDVKTKAPSLGIKLERRYQEIMAELASGVSAEDLQQPISEQKAPTNSSVTGADPR